MHVRVQQVNVQPALRRGNDLNGAAGPLVTHRDGFPFEVVRKDDLVNQAQAESPAAVDLGSLRQYLGRLVETHVEREQTAQAAGRGHAQLLASVVEYRVAADDSDIEGQGQRQERECNVPSQPNQHGLGNAPDRANEPEEPVLLAGRPHLSRRSCQEAGSTLPPR